MDLKTYQEDFTQLFAQAKVPDPVLIKIPHGWFVDADGKLKQLLVLFKYNDTAHYIRLR